MKFIDLEPRLVRFETKVEPYTVIVGDHETWRQRGCPTQEITGPREYQPIVNTVAEAQGVLFLCPACFEKNGGARGTHGILVAFHDRGVEPRQGSHNAAGEPSRWHVSGESLENLTLQPSIDVGCWHGFITNGEAR